MIAIAVVALVMLGFVLFFLTVNRKSFRGMLPQELAMWLNEEIIDEETACRLRVRYRLNQLEGESQAILVKTIFGFGITLIALGIIAFGAAHWETIPKYGKLGLLTSLMLAADIIGFWFWNRRDLPHLGHALVVLGSLIFAIVIDLVARSFHLPGGIFEGLLFWTLGALAMGYAVQSLPLFLLGVAAFFVWQISRLGDNPLGFPIFIPACPAFVLPYAIKKQYRSLHFLVWLLWGIAIVVTLNLWEPNRTIFWLISGGVSFVWLLWGYSDWQAEKIGRELVADTRLLAALSLAIISYMVSFHQVTTEAVNKALWWNTPWRPVMAVVLIILAIGLMLLGFRKNKQQDKGLGYFAIGGSGLLTMVIPLLHGTGALALAVVFGNIATVGLGIFLFHKGLSEMDRRSFWLALILFVAIIIGRFFEYETGLLWKSAAFILTGVMLMSGGIFFEKKRGRKLRNEG